MPLNVATPDEVFAVAPLSEPALGPVAMVAVMATTGEGNNGYHGTSSSGGSNGSSSNVCQQGQAKEMDSSRDG